MLRSLALAFAATAAAAAETGETRTQRITSFLPFVNVDGEAFYGQRQLAIVAAMAAKDFNARDGHLVPRFAVDFTLAASREQRAQLAAALRNVAAFDHHRRAVGARPIAVAIVEPIDWASLLRYSIFASPRDLNVLRGVVDGMVRADPRLRREAENVRAPIRVATRIQRAWRSRRAAKGDASASSP